MKLAWVILILAVLVVAAPAAAQQNEIAAWIGFMGGGEPDPSAAWGVTYSRFLNRSQSIDVSFLSQSTTLETERASVRPEIDFQIQYYHAGGRYTPIGRGSRVRPYVSMTLGMTRFVAEPGNSEARFSVGFGGGSNIMLPKHLAFRFDARLYTTLAVSGAAIYCEPRVCTFFGSGGALYQFIGAAGLVLNF